MKCPKCKTVLVHGGYEHLQDLSEHVCSPNNIPSKKEYFICPNIKCVCNTEDVWWINSGEMFKGSNIFKYNQLTAPYGTFERQLQVEIYGRGLNRPLKRKIYLSSWWCFRLLKPYIEFTYKSNMNGDILGRKWSLKFLKYDEPNRRMHTPLFKRKENLFAISYISYLSLILFRWRRFWRTYNK